MRRWSFASIEFLEMRQAGDCSGLGNGKLDDSFEILRPPENVKPRTMGIGFVEDLSNELLRRIALDLNPVANLQIAGRKFRKAIKAANIIIAFDFHFDSLYRDIQFRRPVGVIHRQTGAQRPSAEGAGVRT